MGEVPGIPEWLVATLFVMAGLVVIFGIAWRNTKRQVENTAERRRNLTQEQFIGLMRADVSENAARFLWQTALPYVDGLTPPLTPHPEDDLARDLPIDDEDWSIDWPREWADRHGFNESKLHDWPEGWPITVRNYGRWLDLGPES